MCQILAPVPTTPITLHRVCASPSPSAYPYLTLSLTISPAVSTTTPQPYRYCCVATMSAAKPEQPVQQPPQQQPTPEQKARDSHLDALQSMLNLIFLQSGRFIKEHQSGGGTGRMKIAMQRAVPVATERFHDALDELENEVRLAQIVLRRDLALLKQDRKKREVAAKEKEAEKARLAAESKSLGSVEKQPEAVVEKVSTPAQQEPSAATSPKPETSLEKPLEREEEHIPPPIDTTAVHETERDPLFDGTPTTANPQDNEFDFDAMFGMDTAGDNNTHDDMMDTSGNMDFNFDEEGPSLLQGLEDFAKAGDDSAQDIDIDMAMPDLPGLEPAATEPPAPAPEQPPAPKAATPPPPAPPAEPTTTTEPPAPAPDAAANTADADTANDDLMGGMMTDNLDDLFNMDEYENPEQSSFDDAFFNFE
jgi:hypothetical protein